MQIPVEIFRIILKEVFASHYTNTVSDPSQKPGRPLYLRLVNSFFNDEVLTLLFRSREIPWGIIDSNNWHRLHVEVQALYVHQCVIKRRHDSLFTYLFLPVFERQLAQLRIAEDNHAARCRLLTKWFPLLMHKYWQLEWVVAHTSEKTAAKVQHFLERCDFANGAYDDSNTLTNEDRLEKRVENDRKFLEICTAILYDDSTTVLHAFGGFCTGVNDVNLCFGTTLLGFTAKCGSPKMLGLLLRSVPKLRPEDLRRYIRIAATEHSNAAAMVKVLLDKFAGQDTSRTAFARDMLLKARLDKDATIFNAVLAWMTTLHDVPGKLRLFEHLYELDLTQYHERHVSHMLAAIRPPPHQATVRKSLSEILPAHHLGYAYEAQLTALFRGHQKRVRSAVGYWHHVTEYAYTEPRTVVYWVVRNKHLIWFEWLLWAGADPRHFEGEVSILEVAWNVKVRDEVAMLLDWYGWDCARLQVEIG